MSGEVEARLARVEEQLERIAHLLENGAGPLGRARAGAERALQAEHPGELGERLEGLLLRMADPETLSALERLALLVPSLEYAAQALAAGPELLEEGLAKLRQKMAAAGVDEAEASRRAQLSLQVVQALSQPRSLASLSRLAAALPGAGPIVAAAAAAGEALAAAEGEAALSSRLGESLTQLLEPETLGALTRLAQLAPDLELAAHFAAAAPALLEELTQKARVRLERGGLDEAGLRLRAQAAGGALAALTEPAALSALAQLAGALPQLAGLAQGLTLAAQQLGALGQGVLSDRLGEVLSRLADEEVLSSLSRIVGLLPDLEYAVQALAAGPALLEEGMEKAQAWARHNGFDPAGVSSQLGAFAGIARKLADPAALRALDSAVSLLPKLDHSLGEAVEKVDPASLVALAAASTRPDSFKTLRRLIDLAPGAVEVLEALPTQAATLRVLTTLNAAVAEAAAAPQALGPWGLLRALREPEVQRAAGFGLEVARRLGRELERKQLPR
jgi:Protein of unknown function (DUF1641)